MRFWAFLGKESPKTPEMFLQKVHVENILQKNDRCVHVRFSSTFSFPHLVFRVFLSDMNSPRQETPKKTSRKTHTLDVLQSYVCGVFELPCRETPKNGL
jgi:hypothetical protein